MKSARARLRFALIAGSFLLGGAAAPLGVAAWTSARAERAYAERIAATAAEYLAAVTNPARGGSADYDLSSLLVRSRALAALPNWSPAVEVYHGTAPFVAATAPPLTPDAFADLQRDGAVRWDGSTALAPLRDRNDGDVVGAVRIGPRGASRGAFAGFALPALALVLWLGGWAISGLVRARARVRLAPYALATVALGIVAAANVRGAAADATDRWLADAQLVVEDAATRGPVQSTDVAARTLQRLVRGAELVPADSADAAPRRELLGRRIRAVSMVRLGPNRWLELRTDPGEDATLPWVILAVALALGGPAGVSLAAWTARADARRRRETLTAWGFLAPATAHLAVFSVAPAAFLLFLAVHRWTPGESGAPFVGLDNFQTVLGDPLTWFALGNTLVYVLHVPVAMALALAIAVALHRHRAARRAVRALLLLPYAASTVAVALAWRGIFRTDGGFLNAILGHLGRAPVDWLGDPRNALLAVLIVGVWMQIGYQVTLFLIGLESIPAVYGDAARVDGASGWQRFWRVTFPLLRPVTLIAGVSGVVVAAQVFTLVYVLTGGGPGRATEMISTRIYQTAWGDGRFGEAGALAVLLCVALLGATWAELRLLRRNERHA